MHIEIRSSRNIYIVRNIYLPKNGEGEKRMGRKCKKRY